MEMITMYLQNSYILKALIFWDLVWRGLALWKASKNQHKYWFVALLISNTMGILPIIYLLINKFRFSKQAEKQVEKQEKVTAF